jgi:hypothetical protein
LLILFFYIMISKIRLKIYSSIWLSSKYSIYWSLYNF